MVARIKIKTDTYQRESLIELENSVLDTDTGSMLYYRHLRRYPKYKDAWNISSANEFGKLAQGVGSRVKGTDTIYFLHKRVVPQDIFKYVTYVKFVCDVCPTKADPNRKILNARGDIINYPGDCETPTDDILLVKILVNSVILTTGYKFMTGDIKNFYLNKPLKLCKYVRLRLEDIPGEIVT